LKNIIGIRFKKLGKIYFFNPKGLKVKKGDKVIVETTQGEEYAEVLIPNRYVEDDKIVAPLKKVLRIATYKDTKRFEECKKIEKEAFKVCEEKIKTHKLNMVLTEVECKFDNSKIIFYFTADGRIDFRDLVRDLAAIYKTRIEMRQIGVRDEVKRIGGNGVCGRELCCCTFLSDFETVSIKMAKEQNISLNPSKISGNCGRLMCCLKYENEVYEEKLKHLPNVGAIVKTEDGEGEVDNIEILKEKLRVKLKNEDGVYTYKKYDVKDVKIIKDIAREQVDEEEIQNKKELEELEKLEQEDKKVLGGEKNGI
jgi:cell fate regulator YaaT (PSP1 superfamily)